MQIHTKFCNQCNQAKPIGDFDSDRAICKKCVYKAKRAKLKASPEKFKAYQESQRRWNKENKERKNLNHLKWRQAHLNTMLLCNAKSRAKRFGIAFNLKVEDIIIPEYCPVLGIKLVSNIGGGSERDFTPSLDRIDSSKGYVKGNVKVISLRANVIKNSGTIEEHEKIIAYMKQNS